MGGDRATADEGGKKGKLVGVLRLVMNRHLFVLGRMSCRCTFGLTAGTSCLCFVLSAVSRFWYIVRGTWRWGMG
jgi:hypothetical protein